MAGWARVRSTQPAVRGQRAASIPKLGISGVAEEAGDGDVGEADVAEPEASLGRFALEIVERGGNAVIERVADAILVGRFVPDQGPDNALIEQAPDEKVAETGIGIFLEPAGARAVPRIGG